MLCFTLKRYPQSFFSSSWSLLAIATAAMSDVLLAQWTCSHNDCISVCSLDVVMATLTQYTTATTSVTISETSVMPLRNIVRRSRPLYSCTGLRLTSYTRLSPTVTTMLSRTPVNRSLDDDDDADDDDDDDGGNGGGVWHTTFRGPTDVTLHCTVELCNRTDRSSAKP